MTAKELAKYLKLHRITIWKHAGEGNIPGLRVGSSWRFDKEAIDKWISGGNKKPHKVKKSKAKSASKAVKVKLRKKKKS
jgi:excisionase family DNA binding protein